MTPAFSKLDGSGRWLIGVDLERPVVITQLGLGAALRESIDQNIKSASLIYQFLQGLIERRMSAKSIEGPIGIARLSGDAAREGPMAFVGLMAMVSLNLAVFNLLPIPILDGGLILLLLIEMIMRRDMSMQVKEAVFQGGHGLPHGGGRVRALQRHFETAAGLVLPAAHAIAGRPKYPCYPLLPAIMSPGAKAAD